MNRAVESFNPSAVAEGLAEMEFRELGKFNEGGAGVFWTGAGGTSPWEMHPDCEELLHVLEGAIDLEVLPAEGGEGSVTRLEAGSFIIIPRGCWHRQTVLQKTREFYLTPGRSLHSMDEDPRE